MGATNTIQFYYILKIRLKTLEISMHRPNKLNLCINNILFDTLIVNTLFIIPLFYVNQIRFLQNVLSQTQSYVLRYLT